jgi:hypothetical protein
LRANALVFFIHRIGFDQGCWVDFNRLTPAILSIFVGGNGALVVGATQWA